MVRSPRIARLYMVLWSGRSCGFSCPPSCSSRFWNFVFLVDHNTHTCTCTRKCTCTTLARQFTPVLLSLFLVLCVTSTSLLRLIDGRDRLPPRGCSFLFNRPITTPEFSIFGSVPSLYFLPETDQTFRISQYFFPLCTTLPFRLSGDANNESRIFRTSATGTSVPVSPNPKRFAPCK